MDVSGKTNVIAFKLNVKNILKVYLNSHFIYIVFIKKDFISENTMCNQHCAEIYIFPLNNLFV